MTATSLGAGWDLFFFGEPRPDLAFLWAWGSKDMGQLGMFFFHRETFQAKKKTHKWKSNAYRGAWWKWGVDFNIWIQRRDRKAGRLHSVVSPGKCVVLRTNGITSCLQNVCRKPLRNIINDLTFHWCIHIKLKGYNTHKKKLPLLNTHYEHNNGPRVLHLLPYKWDNIHNNSVSYVLHPFYKRRNRIRKPHSLKSIQHVRDKAKIHTCQITYLTPKSILLPLGVAFEATWSQAPSSGCSCTHVHLHPSMHWTLL